MLHRLKLLPGLFWAVEYLARMGAYEKRVVHWEGADGFIAAVKQNGGGPFRS